MAKRARLTVRLLSFFFFLGTTEVSSQDLPGNAPVFTPVLETSNSVRRFRDHRPGKQKLQSRPPRPPAPFASTPSPENSAGPSLGVRLTAAAKDGAKPRRPTAQLLSEGSPHNASGRTGVRTPRCRREKIVRRGGGRGRAVYGACATSEAEVTSVHPPLSLPAT